MKRMKPIMLAVGLSLFVQAAQAQWEPTQRLTWTPGETYRPRAAVDSSGDLYLVWFDLTPGDFEVYYKKSTDGGATWFTNKRLTWNSGDSATASIAADSSAKLHLFWEDNAPGNYEIYYKKSADGGATWSKNKRLTWNSGSSASPAIAVDSSDRLHVVWEDRTPGNYELYYKRSSDGGATWSTGKRLTWTAGDSHNVAFAVDSSGRLHVAWDDNTPGNSEVYYKRSTDGGATWSKNKRLTWTAGQSDLPAIVVDTLGRLHVVWSDYTSGNSDIYHRKSTDGGATWTSGKRLSWTSGNSWSPAISVDTLGNLHLVWSDYTPGNFEIYYKESLDGGATWTSGKRLSWTSGNSWSPAIVAYSSDNLHLFWYDGTPGNNEIYYRRQK